jgi:hypothetical protein
MQKQGSKRKLVLVLILSLIVFVIAFIIGIAVVNSHLDEGAVSDGVITWAIDDNEKSITFTEYGYIDHYGSSNDNGSLMFRLESTNYYVASNLSLTS